MEEDGLLAWTGKYRNGFKVYIATAAGPYAFDKKEARRMSRATGATESHADSREFLRDAVEEYADHHETTD